MAAFATALPIILSGANMLLDANQQNKQRKLQNAQSRAQEALQAQQQADARKRFDAQNKENLSRALAARRASAAARGMGGVGGSADAVMNGLISESEKQRRNFLTDQSFARNSLLGQNAFQRKKNLLDQQTSFLDAGLGFAKKQWGG
ncbi:hypothetical protein [Varunaivibrio sulfuroxidans]|uniref:Uncharacterized protein n=1 Tax=Varunaivibrio sulfuroxidans TaxID=1773489 RepID=A0A4R3J878_9PROT|nr:hypothetical protein [Varunaivibrio sulfuroxidans]TCS61687.1 hypothetical protein EDD55_10796 [Varunaivibrio sulfuroxidans]WES32130.1 hypothetical protein P3M64_07165 [Varunaivibrio sulfuroxidans]